MEVTLSSIMLHSVSVFLNKVESRVVVVASSIGQWLWCSGSISIRVLVHNKSNHPFAS